MTKDRDLGQMGESTMELWCAQAGLVANGSKIDKSGWDFYLEFPFEQGISTKDLHRAAFECKVQVKATDAQRRRVPIKLSNMRRLVTAQMPAFVLVLEFDGGDTVSRAYLIHVDEDIISRALKRMHELNQRSGASDFHKSTLSLGYSASHLLPALNGVALHGTISNYIGESIEKYVENKRKHMESAGYEEGFAQFTFNTVGEDNLSKLVDVSLGIEKEVDIADVKGAITRFGITTDDLGLEVSGGKLQMPDIKPCADGSVIFREEKLSAGLSFRAQLYTSAFYSLVPEKFKVFRVVGDFFELRCFPYSCETKFSYAFGDMRMDVRELRNALRLINLIASSAKELLVELKFKGSLELDFTIGTKAQESNYKEPLEAIECATQLLSIFDVCETVDISIEELAAHEAEIRQFARLITHPASDLVYEFGVEGDDLDIQKKVALISMFSVPIGSHIFAVILVAFGWAEALEDNQFKLETKDYSTPKKIFYGRQQPISGEALNSAIREVEERYEANYNIVTMGKWSANSGCS